MSLLVPIHLPLILILLLLSVANAKTLRRQDTSISGSSIQTNGTSFRAKLTSIDDFNTLVAKHGNDMPHSLEGQTSFNTSSNILQTPPDPFNYDISSLYVQMKLSNYRRPHTLISSSKRAVYLMALDTIATARLHQPSRKVTRWKLTKIGVTVKLNFNEQYSLENVATILTKLAVWVNDWDDDTPLCDIELTQVGSSLPKVLGSGFFGAWPREDGYQSTQTDS